MNLEKRIDNEAFRWIAEDEVDVYTDMVSSAVLCYLHDMDKDMRQTFDAEREIFHLDIPTSFVLAYRDQNLRDNDITAFLNLKSILEKDTVELQKPRISAVFTFRDWHCLYIVEEKPAKGETNPERGLFKGVIVNPEKFLGWFYLE